NLHSSLPWLMVVAVPLHITAMQSWERATIPLASVENSLPQLVEGKDDIAAAVSLDGGGINIHRAIGRAFAGLVIGYWGMLDSAIRPLRRGCRKLKSRAAKQASAGKLFCAREW
ncbi:MFS transporter, partial [Noviherbaspirillum sp. Root189]|uniref:MFS transporter n=1 Tax=Noviherbaspirillum sp. Root189 TaxID=1736487 RepID=UPI0012E33DBE